MKTKKMITSLLIVLLSPIVQSSTSIKFIAKTDGPGITVEGEAKNSQIKLDFNKLNSTVVSIDAMDLSTGMERRDKHMREKVFNSFKPGDTKIEYSVSSVTCPEDPKNLKDEVLCDSMGTMTIKNSKNELPMKVLINKKTKTVSGSSLISLSQFKLEAPSFMGVTVEDKVEVTFKASME